MATMNPYDAQDYKTMSPQDEQDYIRQHNAKALEQQVGGNHYKDMPIQPVEFIVRNDLGFCEGNAIKYLCRWKLKGGIEDLRKARHYIDMLIESHV